MKFNIFIDEYKLAQDKNLFLSQHVKNTYILYETKVADCTNIVEGTSHKMVPDPITGEDHKVLWQNTPGKFLLFTMNLVARYFDVEIDISNDGTELFAKYNQLQQNGILNSLLSYVPEAELKEYNALLQMCADDVYQNEMSMSGYLDTKFESVRLVLDTLMNVFSENIPSGKADNIIPISKQEK